MEVTEATVSDSLRVLQQRFYLTKECDPHDRRVKYFIATGATIKLCEKLRMASNLPLSAVPFARREVLAQHLHMLVAALFSTGNLSHARICHTCKYFTMQINSGAGHCGLLGKTLRIADLRHDCPEHELPTTANRHGS